MSGLLPPLEVFKKSAGVAKLADALVSGISGSNPLGVRIPLPAHKFFALLKI